MSLTLFLSAGEPSGDLHGSELARELKRLDPTVRLVGMGGPKMAAEGVELYKDISDTAVVGLFDVLKAYSRFKKILKLLSQKIETDNPSAVVLIDYPGFHLRLAETAKRLGKKVIYYISPQIWAWAPGRIQTIKRLVDHMITILPFEEALYQKAGVPVSFVGNPLLDLAKPTYSREEALKRFSLNGGAATIGILPGSRESEIEQLLPALLSACEILHEKLEGRVQFILPKSPNLPSELYERLLRRFPLPLSLVEGKSYDAINVSDLCFVCSGTATLETAVLGKPMLVLYKVGNLSWFLFRPLVRIPNIGLANVVAGKRVVPELLQFEATPQRIAQEALAILQDPARIKKITEEWSSVRSKLGTPGASRRAAEVIMSVIASEAKQSRS